MNQTIDNPRSENVLCPSRVIGIDFGTHKTLVARWDESISRPVLVRLRPAHGDDMPSSVHVDQEGKFNYGDEADRLGALDPDGYQRAFKRDLGIDAAPYLLHTHEFTAADLSREYLRWIKNIVETECLHDTVEHAVFTVPSTWLPSAREALRQAASDAGFASLDLMDEPVAAGMAFLHSRRDLWSEGALMVFDWGAGTLDLAVLTLENGQPRAIPDLIGGKPSLGGEDIDRHLVQSVNKRLMHLGLTKLERRPPEDLEQVRRAVTDWKIRHSAKPNEVWRLPAFADATDATEMNWTSVEIASRIEEIIKEAVDAAEEMLKKASARNMAPKGILLVGGSSQFPSLSAMLESRFPGLSVFTWDQRISAVAMGAVHSAFGEIKEQKTNKQQMNRDPYEVFQERSHHLLKILGQTEVSLQEIDMHSSIASLKKLTERLKSERFKVIVLGEFKRGKSTLINSLLGREILPAFATPCTAIINELKWGPEPKAVLHFKSPLPEKLPKGLPQEALDHLKKFQGSEVPPLSIEIEQLERYVSIPDPSKDQAASISETPYDHAEIFWPLDLLKNSVEIIDSPGLNEHGSRTRITMDYLSRIDAVMFVFSVHAMASQSELNVIDHDVRGAGHEYLFFVCNRFDEIRKQADRDRVTQYSYEQLSPRTAFGKEGVYFVSALDAVIGREENNPALVERSKIPVLESRLASFLVYERGVIKLLQPARQLEQTLAVALGETIPNQRRMLQQDLAELQRKSDEAGPKLAETVRLRENLVERLNRARQRIRDSVRDSASIHLRSVADQVPGWAKELNLDQRINALKVWAIEAQVEAVAAAVFAGVSPMIEQATVEWRETRLRSLIEDALADFNDTAEISVGEFMSKLDHIRAGLAGLSGSVEVSGSRISSAERVLSGVGGLVLGGAGAAIEGAAMGYQGMLKGVVTSVAISVGAIAILHLNPITIVPALLAMGLLRTAGQGDALTNKVKTEAGREIAKALLAQSSDQAESIADAVYSATEKLVESVSDALDEQIEAVREQIEAVLQLKKAGEMEVEKRHGELNSSEKNLQALGSELNQFIQSLSRTANEGDSILK